MTTTAAKICIACGQDCSSKPRTKDLQGRYTCKACYDRLMAARTAGAQPAAPARPATPPAPVVKVARPKPAPAPAPLAEPEEDNLLGSLVESMGGASCVACGANLAQGAAICTICGTNQATGQQISTQLVKEPKEKKLKEKRRRRSLYIEPMYAGLALFALFATLFFFAMSSQGAFAAYAGLYMLVALTASISAIVCAFLDDDRGWGIVGIASYVVPFLGLAMLYYIFCVSERGMVKALALNGIIAVFGLIILAMQQEAGAF